MRKLLLPILIFVQAVSGYAQNQDSILSTLFQIDEIEVVGEAMPRTDRTQAIITKNRNWLVEVSQPSLVQSLEQLAGMRAAKIGSSSARPIIRGLGHNRLAIIQDGIRHEAQQWGEDHGLEIDQTSVGQIQIIKGPAALLYGSDAIGGALILQALPRPSQTIEGEAGITFRSNNLLWGAHARVEGLHNKWFWRAVVAYTDYADYKVPTNEIEYYSYRIPLYKNTLRNTSGKNGAAHIAFGYNGYNWHTALRIYDTFSREGFFANAHGLEVRLSTIDYDKSRRDIDLPYQQVNHFKAVSHTVWNTNNWSTEIDIAYQHNLREEYSEPVAHGYMPTPDNSLERSFSKHTATLVARTQWDINTHHALTLGFQAEMQHNRRGGWGFIIPDFEQFGTGLYAMWKGKISPSVHLTGGLRYDYTYLYIRPYSDWYQTKGEYVIRSEAQNHHFHSLTGSVGMTYAPRLPSKHGDLILRTNIGRSYRVPTAKELGADGINYHIFRYEQGNKDLHPEQSWQVDLSLNWHNQYIGIQIDPFFNYFENYIYLCPSYTYNEGLQLYRYEEAQVIRAGLEAEIFIKPWKHLHLNVQGDYLWAQQLTGSKRGYGLPFSPPWRIIPEGRFLWTILPCGDGFGAINIVYTGAQDIIVPPEKKTPAWWTLNLAIGQDFKLPIGTLKTSIHADNILNAKYYDHTSFYRLIDVPEPGWNLSVQVNYKW